MLTSDLDLSPVSEEKFKTAKIDMLTMTKQDNFNINFSGHFCDEFRVC